jgi:ATP-dependent RNA helicase DHX36
VVVATNVAETSITIDDVTVVIDCGRVKESGYDPQSRMACLVEGWASRDSIRQRRGRAGRVRPGVAFHLLTSASHAKLPLHSTPEVHRTALEQMVLQVRGACVCELAGTLRPIQYTHAHTHTPPSP